MITEIEVEGIGTMRHLNAWQISRLCRVRHADRHDAPIAMSLGMTLPQFRRGLSPEEQAECRRAWARLMSPDNAGFVAVPQAPRPPAKGEHVPIERQVELGARLIEIRDKLPRGHFRRWVEDKSGRPRGCRRAGSSKRHASPHRRPTSARRHDGEPKSVAGRP